jgi:hypothetical protein
MKDQNLLKGVFLAIIALAFGLGSLRYPIGRLERAGPGFFPLMVSSFLLFLAIVMIGRSFFMEKVATHFSVKNISIILGSLIGFSIFSHYVNMITGIVFLVFFSTLAGTNYSVRRNAMIALVLVGIAFIFQKGLGLQLPLF